MLNNPPSHPGSQDLVTIKGLRSPGEFIYHWRGRTFIRLACPQPGRFGPRPGRGLNDRHAATATAERILHAATEAVQRGGNALLSALDQRPAAIDVTDRNGVVIYHNPACFAFAGRRGAEIQWVSAGACPADALPTMLP